MLPLSVYETVVQPIGLLGEVTIANQSISEQALSGALGAR
jgi:hypothetical protein